MKMTDIQRRALEAIVKWQEATLRGAPENERALIAGTMGNNKLGN